MTKALIAPLRSGLKSTELYVGMAATILMVIWPEFPKESFLAIAAWIFARVGQKSFGLGEKRAWESSELYITVTFAAVKAIFPDIPEEAFYSVLSWTGLRTAVKVKQK